MVLLVWPPEAAIKTLLEDSYALALAPLHVVICGRGMQSEVHVLRIPAGDSGGLGRRALAAINRTQAEILQAMDKVGMRLVFCA
jgi:hypothetical protein